MRPQLLLPCPLEKRPLPQLFHLNFPEVVLCGVQTLRCHHHHHHLRSNYLLVLPAQ
jgi:hypothetical protein